MFAEYSPLCHSKEDDNMCLCVYVCTHTHIHTHVIMSMASSSPSSSHLMDFMRDVNTKKEALSFRRFVAWQWIRIANKFCAPIYDKPESGETSVFIFTIFIRVYNSSDFRPFRPVRR